jgi:tyrosinase
MTETEKTNYVNANKCLFRLPARSGLPGTKNRWDDLVAVHQRMSRTVHGTGQFLPWHRYYLNVFERMLREECAYRGPMTWWDETRDAGRFSASPIFSMTHFGRGPLKTSTNQGTCIITGVFAHTTLNIGPGQNNIPHCLARAVDENLSKAVTQTFVNNCNAHHNFNEMQKCSYYGPHAYGHNAVGAVMSDMDTSPGDPLFFMHHQFINHNWRIWQNGNRAGRLYQINGYTTQTQPATGWQTVTLDYQLSSLGLRPTVTIRDVMDTMGGFLCYRYDY